MKSQTQFTWKIILLSSLLACDGDGILTGVADEAEDLTGPDITHDSIDEPQEYNETVAISASIVDSAGIQSATVLYRQETDTDWQEGALTATEGDEFTGEILSSDVGSAAIEYYITAMDELDNSNCVPEGCPVETWQFAVSGL